MSEKLSDLKRKLEKLQDVRFHPEVIALQKSILLKRQPEIEKLEKQIEDLRNKRPGPKPRWPENTPENVLKICAEYWRGTTEYSTYRIHCWNDKAVWTSYPSGGYSNNMGWNPTPACFYLISFEKLHSYWDRYKRLHELTGRVSDKEMQRLLEEKTKNI